MPQPKPRRLTAAARRRIATAQKERWAKWREEQNATPNNHHSTPAVKKPVRSIGRFQLETDTYKGAFRDGFELGFQQGRRSA